jgi:hypothetical protein
MSLSAQTGRRRERPVAGQGKCVPTLAIEGTPCTRSFSLVNSATAVSGGDGVSDVDLRYRSSNCYGRDPIGAGPRGVPNSETFDFIIVGAGSAGCVLANRLTASGRHRVLPLAAGPSNLYPWLHIPLGFGKLFSDRRFNWCRRPSRSPSATAQSIVAVMATLAFQAGRNPVFPKSQLSCYHTD